MVSLPAASSLNITPQPPLRGHAMASPPPAAEPYRLPAASATTLHGAPPPGPPSKLRRTVNAPEVSILNRVPPPFRDCSVPPAEVVPYKLPAASRDSPARGSPPSKPLKACTTVSFPAGSTLKTTPHPEGQKEFEGPPSWVKPQRFPAA